MAKPLLVLSLLAFLAWALFAGTIGLATALFKCEECVGPGTGDWTNFEGAWQWGAVGALGAITIFGAIAFVIALRLGLQRDATWAFLVQLIAVVLLFAVRATGSAFQIELAHAGGFLIGEGAGVAAIRMAAMLRVN